MLEGAGAVLTMLVAAGLLGGLTGLVAAGKGHAFWTWVAVGVLLPLVGLVVVMVGLPDRSEPPDGPSQTAIDATRRSPVARSLASGGPGTRQELTERLAVPDRRVKLELTGLADLGMAAREGTIWQLSEQGAETLADVGPADDAVADAVRASAAALALLAGPGSEDDVAGRAGLTRRQARLQLTGLAGLDIVACDDGDRWRLTDQGRGLLAREA